MGLTKVTTKLTSLVNPQKSFESLFLVDTGATDSMAPSDELEKLGVKQEGKMAYELADGTVREYPFGLVRIEFMGETTAGRVIFAAPGTEPLLGVTALDSVGIIIDPANKTLKRFPAMLTVPTLNDYASVGRKSFDLRPFLWRLGDGFDSCSDSIPVSGPPLSGLTLPPRA